MLLAALILGAALAWLGRGARVSAGPQAAGPVGVLLASLAGTAGGLAPLSRLWPSVVERHAPLAGDARSHAIIAHAWATRGAQHGYLDAYQGGFPLALHYPALGWALDACLMKLGLSAAQATSMLGLSCCAASALLAGWFAGRATGSRVAAAAAATFLAAVSSSPPITGGVGAFLDNGVLSQVVATPLAVLLAGGVLVPRSRLPLELVGAALMAAHPQIAAAALIVTWTAALALADRAPLRRAARATWAAAALGAVTYGPGLATLRYPFGWPDLMPWHIVGFGTSRFEDWFLDGRLLDDARDPWLTAIAAGSLVLALARARHPAARALLASTAVVVTLTALGPSLPRLGRAGQALLTFAQPMRVLAMFPLLGSALAAWGAAVAARSLSRALARVTTRSRARAWAASLTTALVAWSVVDGWPALRRLARERAATTACPWDGAEAAEVASWLAALRGGRLHFEERSVLCDCAYAWGFDATSGVPIATSSSAGAHVGDHFRAFHQIAITEPGADRRADTLGVRWVLAAHDEPPAGAFLARRSSAHATLWEREGGRDLVGVGCVREAWADDATLQPKLKARLRELLDAPRHLVVVGDAPVEPCALEASVVEREGGPGALAATVDAQGSTVVVLRVTAHPFWRVRVDGAERAHLNVVPGFVAVPVGAGRHEIDAVFRLPWALLGAWLTVAAALAWSTARAYSTSRST